MRRYKLKPPGSIRINGKPSICYYITWTEAGSSHRISTTKNVEQDAKRWLADYAAAVNAPPVDFDIAMMCAGYLLEAPGEKHHMKALTRLLGHLTLPALNRAQVRMFHTVRRSEGASDSTINRQCRVLRAAIQWAYKEAWIDQSQIPYIEAPKPAGPRERFLTYDEFMALYAGAGSDHLRVFLALAIWTGQRAGALLELTWADIDLERGFIYFPQSDTNKRRARVVAINEPLALALGRALFLRDTDYVVSYNGQRVRSIKKAFKRAVERSGLENVRTHDLRRSAASWILQSGGTFEDASNLLRDDIRTVQRHYAQFNEANLRSVTDRIATRGNAHYARNAENDSATDAKHGKSVEGKTR